MLATLVQAARLPFLILTPLCLALGLALLRLQGVQTGLGDIMLVLTGALLVHVAVNGFNEYFDFRSGLDLLTRRTPFSGGSGALPARPMADQAVLLMSVCCLLLASLIGVRFLLQGGWPLLLLCLTGSTIAVAYSPLLNRDPFACYLAPGLGFGPVMVLAGVLALGGSIGWVEFWVACAAGIWVSQLLLMNQIPDEQADRAVGRRHLVVLWGRSGALEFSLVPLLISLLLLAVISLALGSFWVVTAAIPVCGLIWLALRGAHQNVNEAVLGANLGSVLLSLLALVMGLVLAG